MNTQQVANRLVELCRMNKNLEIKDDLYDINVVSIEPPGGPVERTEGLEAVLQKAKFWYERLQVIHKTTISDPIIAGNFFSCTMKMDVTVAGWGRVTLDEVCVYQVSNGKIIFEQFFYNFDAIAK